jgi:hypothetical protein
MTSEEAEGTSRILSYTLRRAGDLLSFGRCNGVTAASRSRSRGQEGAGALRHCRTDIVVPPRTRNGDHIKCGTCATKHKVVRGEVLRLVIADVAR